MNKSFIVFALFSFLLLSCDGGLKFENPLDGHNQDSQTERGELGGECYANKTCNFGLVCDEESNTCMKEPEGDTSPTDSGTPEPTDTGTTEPDEDSGDTVPDGGDSSPDNGDSADDSDSGDSTPDNGDTADLDAEMPDSDNDGIEIPDAEIPDIDYDDPEPIQDSEPVYDGDTEPVPADPCDPNPCDGVANSTEICASSDVAGYTCLCNEHYTWKQSTLSCKADTQTANCTGLPANAQWNNVSSITQTWNGADWMPSTAGSYNTTASSAECRYKCRSNYYWHNSECTNPCDSDPCSGVANSAGVCTATSWQHFSCGCSDGFFWDGSSCRISLGKICTGQNKCYDNSSQITCPASSSTDFYGQDAWYAALGKCTPQNFEVKTLQGQNVVVDNNTGLVWQQAPSTETYTWGDAVNACSALNNSNYAGFNDWRLPTPLDFQTIADISRSYPTVNSIFADMPTDSTTFFWTSQEYKENTSNAFYFAPYAGWFWYNKEKTETCKVLCVSGRLPKNSFSETEKTVGGITNVVVTDPINGLMWQKDHVSDKTWKEALEYCENLTYAGYPDWRLPNKNELVTLLDLDDRASAPYSSFPGMPGEWFYSSSTFSTTSKVWLVGFDDGNVHLNSKTGSYSVRCVRSDYPTGGYCGDGIRQANEICDDGINNGTAGYCNAGCAGVESILPVGRICTGQTSCYDASSAITCLSSSSDDFYGQDAQYTDKCTPMSFTAFSDVVVDKTIQV